MRSITILAGGALAAALAWGAATAETGVPPGADKKTWRAALAEMEPVVLQTQTAGGPGGVTGIYVEAYTKAVEDWSGGKIRFDIAWGSAIIRGGASPALSDGRLFMGAVLPIYHPSKFPKMAGMSGMMHDPGHSPLVSVLQHNAAATDAVIHTPEILAEYEDEGILLGLGGLVGSPMTLYCRDERRTLAQMKGAVVRVGSVENRRQVEAMGMSPVSMTYGEVFEAMQRGVADCTITHAMVYGLVGLDRVAPYATLGDKASFTGGNSGVAFDKTAFDELPLAARQLLIDRLDVYFEGQVRGYLRELMKAGKAMAAAGGGIAPMDAAAEEALADISAKLVAESKRTGPFQDNAAVVERLQAAEDKWLKILDELGYVAMDKGWSDVHAWLDPETIDLGPYIARVYQEAILPIRPTE